MNSYVVNLYPVPNDSQPGQTIDVTSPAASFTQALDYKTTCCFITTYGADCYVTFDGTTPSASNGHRIVAPFSAYWSKEATRTAKFIAIGGNTAHITMSQFTY